MNVGKITICRVASPQAGWKVAEKFHCKAAHGKADGCQTTEKSGLKDPVNQKTRHTDFT